MSVIGATRLCPVPILAYVFQAFVLSVQPNLFFGQSGIFLAQLAKVGELVTGARFFQYPHRRDNGQPVFLAQAIVNTRFILITPL